MPKSQTTDSIYRTPLADIGGFQFNQQVVDVFPDMLERSVPGYRSVIAQSGLLAARFAREGTEIVDLGCSLGATLLAMRHAIGALDCKLTGVDNSAAMVERCRKLILQDNDHWIGSNPDYDLAPVSVIEQNIQSCKLQNLSVAALNFTLQFVPAAERDDLLGRISQATHQGGALILSEKIKFDDEVLNELYIDRYHAFKKANGYSDMEISQKRTALENVLIPDTLETHKTRLLAAGYAHCSVWFQCFNFVSIIAIK